MSRATPDDQLKFLLNCVKHSNNGKIDFVEVAKECGIVSKGAAAKRYERLMKANGIHPNGGPSPALPMTAAPVSKTMSKAAIAKAAVAKKRKIEGKSAGRFKCDEEDEPVKPKSEPVFHQNAYSEGKAGSILNPDMPLPAINFALSNHPPTAMGRMPHQQQFDNTNSIFDEFCTPEMFTQHNFEDVAVKAEQPSQPLTPPPQQPRYIPPPPPVMVEYLKQSSNSEGRRESGKGPLESIIIAD